MRNAVWERIEKPQPSLTVATSRSTFSRRRTGFIVAGVAAALSIVLVTGIVPLGSPGASAKAAEVLRAAAAATITTSDPVVPDGQYLKVATTASYLSSMENESGGSVAWLTPSTFDLYIPADRSLEAVQERRELKPTTFFGAGSEAVALEAYNSFKSRREVNGIRRGNTALLLNRSNTLAEIEQMPRDPGELKLYIDAHATNAASQNEAAWLYIIELLRTGVIPADLRASLYEAAVLIEGVTYVDDSSTLDGRTGIAIGRVEPTRDERQDIIIDPATGVLIGERTVTLIDRGVIPAGTSTSWTSIRTTLETAAP
jgi:hypothetical protein